MTDCARLHGSAVAATISRLLRFSLLISSLLLVAPLPAIAQQQIAQPILPATQSVTGNSVVEWPIQNSPSVTITVSGIAGGSLSFTALGRLYGSVSLLNVSTLESATGATADGSYCLANAGFVRIRITGTGVSGPAVISATTGYDCSASSDGGGGGGATAIDTIVTAEDATPTDAFPGIVVFCRQLASPAGTSVTDGDLTFLNCPAGRLATTTTIEGGAIDVQEDEDHTTGATGPFVLNVYSPTPASTTATPGQYAGFISSTRGGTWVTPLADPLGGANPLPYVSAGATEDEHAVCTAACTIYSIMVSNINAAARYLRCNNDTAANTAPGSETLTTNGGGGTLVFTSAIPGNTAAAGFAVPIPVAGIAFSTAATCWLVTGAAITDVAEVAANEIQVNYSYKQ